MALYLGSEPVEFTIEQPPKIMSPIANQIIQKKMYGEYSNSRVSYVGDYAFAYCSNLTSVNFSNCSYIGDSAFYNCSNLTSISFSNCSYIGSFAFYYCYNLTSISFPNCSYIGSSAFGGCYHLVSFNLIGISSVPTLGTEVFYNTPIGGYSASAGQYGSVYVPASLYSSFLTATNWSSISSRIISV